MQKHIQNGNKVNFKSWFENESNLLEQLLQKMQDKQNPLKPITHKFANRFIATLIMVAPEEVSQKLSSKQKWLKIR